MHPPCLAQGAADHDLAITNTPEALAAPKDLLGSGTVHPALTATTERVGPCPYTTFPR